MGLRNAPKCCIHGLPALPGPSAVSLLSKYRAAGLSPRCLCHGIAGRRDPGLVRSRSGKAMTKESAGEGLAEDGGPRQRAGADRSLELADPET